MKTISSRSEKIIRLAIAGAAIIVAFCAGTARAATVIHYDGINASYTGGLRANWGGVTDPHFTLPTPVDTGTEVRTWKYSDTTPISPATGYTGPAIYAALQYDSNAGTFGNLAGQSGIRSGILTYNDDVASGFAVIGSGVGSSLTAMIFFKPDVGDGQTVSFDASSSISLTGAAGGSDWQTGMRFVVQSDGQWYISDVVSYTTTNSPAATSRIWTLNDLGSYSFASFAPENAAPLPVAPISGFDTLGSSFTDITAVGYNFSTTGPTNNLPWISMWDFTVNATVVPEPSTTALLLIGSAVAAALVFARRRQSSIVS